MEYIVPPSLLFEYQLSIPACDSPTGRKTGKLLSLPEDANLFIPASLNGTTVFAAVSVGWNKDGLGISVNVQGKPEKPLGDSARLSKSDCLLLWIDTRTAGNVHRATEYCHSFACLPADDAVDGQPNVVSQPIAQQRNFRQESNSSLFLTRTHVNKEGYEFEVWIPGSQLHGFREINDLGRLGFYCFVNDSHLGEQPLIVGDDFPTSYDPSTWLQLELKS